MSEAKDWAGELISGQTGTGRILVSWIASIDHYLAYFNLYAAQWIVFQNKSALKHLDLDFFMIYSSKMSMAINMAAYAFIEKPCIYWQSNL